MPGAIIGQLAAKGGAGKPLTLGIRPEAVELALEPRPGWVSSDAHIIEPLGSHDIVDFRIGGATMRARTRAGFVPKPGTPLWVHLDPTRAHLFDADSGNTFGIRL